MSQKEEGSWKRTICSLYLTAAIITSHDWQRIQLLHPCTVIPFWGCCLSPCSPTAQGLDNAAESCFMLYHDSRSLSSDEHITLMPSPSVLWAILFSNNIKPAGWNFWECLTDFKIHSSKWLKASLKGKFPVIAMPKQLRLYHKNYPTVIMLVWASIWTISWNVFLSSQNPLAALVPSLWEEGICSQKPFSSSPWWLREQPKIYFFPVRVVLSECCSSTGTFLQPSSDSSQEVPATDEAFQRQGEGSMCGKAAWVAVSDFHSVRQRGSAWLM